jgi:chloride channel protein, CIC family
VLVGVVTRNQLVKLYVERNGKAVTTLLSGIATRRPEVAFSDEPLRRVVNRMADSGFTRLPVLDPSGNGKLLGMVSLRDLLHARSKNLEDERARERVLRIRMPFGRKVIERNIPLTENSDFNDGVNSSECQRHEEHCEE